MKNNAPAIPARYYVRMGELLTHLGVNVFLVLEQARINPESLLAPEALLRLDQVERLIEVVQESTHRTDLAVEVGRSLKLTSHSIVGFGVITSPTLGEAIQLLARYFRLIMPAFQMEYRNNGQHLHIAIKPIWPMSQTCLIFHFEAMAFAAHLELKELLQQNLPAYDLFLSIPPPPHAHLYDLLSEARCHFLWGQLPGISMRLPAEVTRRRLSMADRASFHMAEKRCKEMVQHAVVNGNFADWVGMMLREACDGIPTQKELARTLNLCTRTLDRHLKKEGYSFRELYRQVRHQRAQTLLQESPMTVTQIAYELGYTDAANFSRSFRREAGMSPLEFRQFDNRQLAQSI